MLKNYIKIAWKVLLRRKFFTCISLFGISITLMVLMVDVALLHIQTAPTKPETKLARTLFVRRVIIKGEKAMNSILLFFSPILSKRRI